MTPITLEPERAEAPPTPAAPSTPSRRRRRRDRVARPERPLLLAGLALVTAHLLDLAFSGPDTSVLGVALILAVPLGWALAQPYVTRPTRLFLGVTVGLLAIGFGVVSKRPARRQLGPGLARCHWHR